MRVTSLGPASVFNCCFDISSARHICLALAKSRSVSRNNLARSVESLMPMTIRSRIKLSRNSLYSQVEPLFKQLNMLKIADQLRLQELKFYFKYIHKNLPAYLLDWEFISNVNIHFHDARTSSKIHTVRAKHEFAKKCLKYNLSHIINDTPAIVVEKIHTHSLRGFATYAKQFLIVLYKIVIRAINIIIRIFFLMDGNHNFYFLVHSLVFIFFFI